MKWIPNGRHLLITILFLLIFFVAEIFVKTRRLGNHPVQCSLTNVSLSLLLFTTSQCLHSRRLQCLNDNAEIIFLVGISSAIFSLCDRPSNVFIMKRKDSVRWLGAPIGDLQYDRIVVFNCSRAHRRNWVNQFYEFALNSDRMQETQNYTQSNDNGPNEWWTIVEQQPHSTITSITMDNSIENLFRAFLCFSSFLRLSVSSFRLHFVNFDWMEKRNAFNCRHLIKFKSKCQSFQSRLRSEIILSR